MTLGLFRFLPPDHLLDEAIAAAAAGEPLEALVEDLLGTGDYAARITP